jgi:hypothetical protein
MPLGRTAGVSSTSPSPLRTKSSSAHSASAAGLSAPSSGLSRLSWPSARRLHHQVLRVDPRRKRQLRVALLDTIAHIEAELAHAPGEHAQGRPLHVFAPQRVETFDRKAGALRNHLVQGKTALLRGLDRQLELVGVGEAQQTGFPGKADDLKNVPEAQILEAPDQAHRAPRGGRRRAARRPHFALPVSIGRQDGYLIICALPGPTPLDV